MNEHEREIDQRLREERPYSRPLSAAKKRQIRLATHARIKRRRVMRRTKQTVQGGIALLVIAAIAVGGFIWWQALQFSPEPITEAIVDPTAVSNNTATTDRTIITFGANSFERSGYEQRIEQFEELYPDIQVQFVPFENGVEDGRLSATQIASLADTAVIDQFTLASGSSAFLSLDPLRTADPAFNDTDFWPNALTGCQPDTQLRGLPVQLSYSFVFYDADLFAQAGIEPPAPDWTWQTFLNAAQATASADAGRYGYVATSGISELMSPFVAANSNNTEQLASELTPLLAGYTALVADETIYDDDIEMAYDLIDNGQAAMWVDTQLNLNFRRSSFGNQIQMAPFPQVNGVNTTPAYADCLVISAGTTQSDAAWTWLTFLTENPPPSSVPGMQLPARRTVAQADSYWQSRLGAETPVGYAAERGVFDTFSAEQRPILSALAQVVRDGGDLTAVLSTTLADAPQPTDVSTTEPIVVATPVPDPADSGITVIRYNTSGFYHASLSTMQAIADDFNNSQTEIEVEVSTDVSPGAGGFFGIEQVADQYDCFADFPLRPEHTQFVYSLTSLLDADVNGLVDDVYPGLFAPFTLEGEIYALPSSVSPSIIYYNAELLAAKGIDPPPLDWTLADLMALAQQARDPNAGVTHGFVPFQVGNPIEWMLAERGIVLYDMSANPPQVAFDNPDLLGALAQLAQLDADGIMYPVLNLGSQTWDDNYGVRERLVVNGNAPFWTDAAGLNGGFGVGELPEFVQPAALPVINGRISPPQIAGFYISRRLADPQPCWEWINFLSAHPESPGSVPARISVAESAAWETAVGAENAAVFRTSMMRQVAQSAIENNSTISTFPLDRWWGDVINAAYEGQPFEPLLAAAQQKGQLYVACMSELTAPTSEQRDACAKEADPDYKTLLELRDS